MKRGVFLVGLVLILSSCKPQESTLENHLENKGVVISEMNQQKQNEELTPITLRINEVDYDAYLYPNDASLQLIELLPIVLTMDDLNGNEKFAYLKNSLPTNSKVPGYVEEGQLMLFGNNCLVLFYENFSTSYAYTSLGKVEDIESFREIKEMAQIEVKIALKE